MLLKGFGEFENVVALNAESFQSSPLGSFLNDLNELKIVLPHPGNSEITGLFCLPHRNAKYVPVADEASWGDGRFLFLPVLCASSVTSVVKKNLTTENHRGGTMILGEPLICL